MPNCFVAKSENPLMSGNQSIYRVEKAEVLRGVLKGIPVGKISITDFLTPTFS
jgi:hypothetical protein